MIYTVTLNPSLDYVIRVEDFETGKVNRSLEEHIFYGGKGINVSAVLAHLGLESCALGFAAGFTGEEIIRGIAAMGLRAELIRVEKGMSRINVKLKSDQETEINGTGPVIGEKDMERLFEKLGKLTDGDVLVLSGSVPPSAGPSVYRQILQQVSGRHVLTVVDAEGELLLGTLPFHPFLIKPNVKELEGIFGFPLKEKGQIVDCARKLQEMGAEHVLVSMAGDGALLLTKEGDCYEQKAARGQVKNSVGAGDSMVAGFLAGYLERRDYQYALKLGCACGGATAFSDGLGTGDEIWKVLGRL